MNRNAPSHWKLMEFREVAEVVTGSTPSTIREDFFGGEIPFVTPTELNGGIPVTMTPVTLTELGANQVRVIPENSVMVCCIGSLGKIGIAGTRLATNQQINSLVFDEKIVCPRYGFHYCQTLKPLLTHLAPSTTVAIINKGRFQELQIPLPPLPEQKRIAAILDKADSIRRKRQEAVRLTEELLRSVYAEKMKISRAPVVSISEMLEQKILLLHKDGNHGSQYPRTEEFGETGIPFLSASCFNDSGGLIESQVQFLNGKKANTLKIGWIKPGDVLLAHNATVGRVALYDGRYEEALIGTSLTAFRTDNVRLKPEFLYCALRSWSFQNQLEKNMGQTTRNQVPITAQRDLTISLPGIDLQEQILNVQRKLNAIFDNLSAGSDYSINLFNSILQRSFKGEI